MASIKRIAILTGGGDCPGLNAVIRAVTKSAISRGLEVVGISEGFGGLVNGLFSVLKESDVSGILPRGGTILGTSNRDDPFHYCSVMGDGETVYDDCSEMAIENLERSGADALVVAGGENRQKFHLPMGEG